MHRRLICCLLLLLVSTAVFAQQTGAIHGRVTATDKSALPGVTVEARSEVLPQPRVTTTDGNGDYRLPALVPGTYTLTFTLAGTQTGTRKATAILSQDVTADIALSVDTRWLDRYVHRTQHPPDDAEKVTVQNGLVTRVHRGITPDAYPCDIIGPFFYEADILTQPLALGGGRAVASDRPGLGVELEEATVEKYRVR